MLPARIWVPRSSQPGSRELGVGASIHARAPVKVNPDDAFCEALRAMPARGLGLEVGPRAQGRRNSEKASFRSLPPAASPELASSATMSAADSASSVLLGGFTVLPSSTSSSGS